MSKDDALPPSYARTFTLFGSVEIEVETALSPTSYLSYLLKIVYVKNTTENVS